MTCLWQDDLARDAVFLSVAHWCLMLVSPMAENVPLTEVLSARLLHCKVTLLYFVINKYSEACKYLISHQKFDLLINLYYYGTALFCFVQCVIICYNHLFILMPTLSSSKPVVALLLDHMEGEAFLLLGRPKLRE